MLLLRKKLHLLDEPMPTIEVQHTSDISYDPDKSTNIYRRFVVLSASDLLFYQADLAELESFQKEFDEADLHSRHQIPIECQRDWNEFIYASKGGTLREKEKMKLEMRIREKLEK
jgi:hypothetical protein